MPERKKLSTDVMKQFVKDPGKVTASDKTPPDAAPPALPLEPSPPASAEPSDLTTSVLAEFKKPEAERKVRITVDLYASRHKRLKAIAADLDTDMSTLVRTLIDKFIDEVDSQ